MCRVLSYLGKPHLLDDFLFKPDNSLVTQTYDPKNMTIIQNLAGFGMATWEDHLQPSKQAYFYRSLKLPFYDRNLKRLALKLKPSCFIAHIRGTPHNAKEVISEQNNHPFIFDEHTDLAFAHNGFFMETSILKNELKNIIKPEILPCIRGTTDSEWIYALFLSQLTSPNAIHDANHVKQALVDTLAIIADIRKRNKLHMVSAMNFFLSNGEYIISTRYLYDFGHYQGDHRFRDYNYHSLWYTFGEDYQKVGNEYRMTGNKPHSICFSSEPLTEDSTTWLEVPEYSIICAEKKRQRITMNIEMIDF